MTAPLSAERMGELKKWADICVSEMDNPCGAPSYFAFPSERLADLLSILDDYSSLRAENELLNNNAMNDYAAHLKLKARAEKAEAQLAKVCERNRLMDDNFGSLLEKNINLEEQLAKQAPLVNALLRIANEAFPLEVTEKCMRSVARAALALREEKK